MIHEAYNWFMKITFLLISACFLSAQDQKKTMDDFVYRHLLLTKSKMEASPLVWQDLKEGFLRNYTIRFADIILDSLDRGDLTSFNAAVRHFQKIENLRKEIRVGRDYKYVEKQAQNPAYNKNYFSSSID